MEMAKVCLRDGSPFGVCLILDGAEVGAPAVPAQVGCTARLGEWDMPQLGLLQVVARGEQRFRIRSRTVQPDGLARAAIELVDEVDAPVPPHLANCARILHRVVAEQPGLFDRPHRLDSALWVSARLAEVLPLASELKQELLEMDAALARLERLSALLPKAPSEPS